MAFPVLPDPTASVLSAEPFSADSLLPGRAALTERLAGHLADLGAPPATLGIIGLLRRDDGWPTAPETLSAVITLVARGVRGDDWVAREGTAEFAVVIAGGPDAGEVVISRLVRTVTGVVTGVAACAGIAALEPGLSAAEVRRRALLSLAAARTQGAGQLVRYRSTR